VSDVEPYLEHLNITVTNVENTIKFLQTAMPEWGYTLIIL
jgi:hypothetical protein